jgi:hypothetical protein
VIPPRASGKGMYAFDFEHGNNLKDYQELFENN